MSFEHGDRELLYRALAGQEEILTKLDTVTTRLADMSEKLVTLNQEVLSLAADITALQEAVARDTDVTSSAATLLAGLKTALDDAIAQLPNQADLDALSAQLGANADALAAAVAANTPTPPAA